jgi:hypothetical protein
MLGIHDDDDIPENFRGEVYAEEQKSLDRSQTASGDIYSNPSFLRSM